MATCDLRRRSIRETVRARSIVQTCVRCGKSPPETNTDYTLISAQFGWRLTRARRDDGVNILEWRCPECWLEHKKAMPPSMGLPSDATGVRRVPSLRAGAASVP